MTDVIVKVPDAELDFFLKLISKFKYKPSVIDEEIPREVRQLVLERKRSARASDYKPAHEVMSRLKKKYGF